VIAIVGSVKFAARFKHSKTANAVKHSAQSVVRSLRPSKNTQPLVLSERMFIRILSAHGAEKAGWTEFTINRARRGHQAAQMVFTEQGAQRPHSISASLAKRIEADTLHLVWDVQYRHPTSLNCVALAEIRIASTGDRFTACANNFAHATRFGRLFNRLSALQKKT
jgi:hypothetical protein